MSETVISAIQAALQSKDVFCKFLSANDTGLTGGHQRGILISKSASRMMFNQNLENRNILNFVRINLTEFTFDTVDKHKGLGTIE